MNVKEWIINNRERGIHPASEFPIVILLKPANPPYKIAMRTCDVFTVQKMKEAYGQDSIEILKFEVLEKLPCW